MGPEWKVPYPLWVMLAKDLQGGNSSKEPLLAASAHSAPASTRSGWYWPLGDVTLSIPALPPPPDKHPLSFEGTAQGFLRGHWLLNERLD